MARPLKNAPFCPIPASGSNFNPQNTQQCIPVVKIFAFLGLEQNGTFFKGLMAGSIQFNSESHVLRAWIFTNMAGSSQVK
jgi:hypothetical protein